MTLCHRCAPSPTYSPCIGEAKNFVTTTQMRCWPTVPALFTGAIEVTRLRSLLWVKAGKHEDGRHMSTVSALKKRGVAVRLSPFTVASLKRRVARVGVTRSRDYYY